MGMNVPGVGLQRHKLLSDVGDTIVFVLTYVELCRPVPRRLARLHVVVVHLAGLLVGDLAPLALRLLRFRFRFRLRFGLRLRLGLGLLNTQAVGTSGGTLSRSRMTPGQTTRTVLNRTTRPLTHLLIAESVRVRGT